MFGRTMKIDVKNGALELNLEWMCCLRKFGLTVSLLALLFFYSGCKTGGLTPLSAPATAKIQSNYNAAQIRYIESLEERIREIEAEKARESSSQGNDSIRSSSPNP